LDLGKGDVGDFINPAIGDKPVQDVPADIGGSDPQRLLIPILGVLEITLDQAMNLMLAGDWFSGV
jgi:hypothetical protein